MTKKKMNKKFKLEVVNEALRPEFEGKEFLVAEKYELRESTVLKWKEKYLKYGDIALSSGFNKIEKEGILDNKNQKEIDKAKDRKIKELEEEIEILKKAAAFLANLDRD